MLSLSVSVSGYKSANGKKTKAIKNSSDLGKVNSHNNRTYETDDYALERTAMIEETLPNLIFEKDEKGIIIPPLSNIRLKGSGDIRKDVRDFYDTRIQPHQDEQNKKYIARHDYKRVVDSYYENSFNHAKRDLCKEVVIKLGDVDDLNNALAGKNADEQRGVLMSYANALKCTILEFKKQNPNFNIVSANIHMDEANPNLHIVGISTKQYDKGVKVRVSDTATFKKLDSKTSKLPIEEQRKIATPDNGTLTYLHNGFKDDVERRYKENYKLISYNLSEDHFKFKATADTRGTYYSTPDYVTFKELKKELDDNINTKQAEIKKFESNIEIELKRKKKLDEEIEKKQSRSERYDEDAKKLIGEAKAQADHYNEQARLININNFLLEEENEKLKEYQSKLINKSKKGVFDSNDLKKYGKHVAKKLGANPEQVNQASNAAYNDFMKTEVFSARESKQPQQTAEVELEY